MCKAIIGPRYVNLSYDELIVFYAICRIKKEWPDQKPRVNEIIDFIQKVFPNEKIATTLRPRKAPKKNSNNEDNEDNIEVNKEEGFILEGNKNIKKSLIKNRLIDTSLNVLVNSFRDLWITVDDEEQNESVVEDIVSRLGANVKDYNIDFDVLVVFYVCFLLKPATRPYREKLDNGIAKLLGKTFDQETLINSLKWLYDQGFIDYNFMAQQSVVERLKNNTMVFTINNNSKYDSTCHSEVVYRIKEGLECDIIISELYGEVVGNLSNREGKEQYTEQDFPDQEAIASDFPEPSEKVAYHEKKLIKKLFQKSYLEDVLGTSIEDNIKFLKQGFDYIWQCFKHYQKSGIKSDEGKFYEILVYHITKTIYQNSRIFGELLNITKPEQISEKLKIKFNIRKKFDEDYFPEDFSDEVSKTFEFRNGLYPWYFGKPYEKVDYVQFNSDSYSSISQLIMYYKEMDSCEDKEKNALEKEIDDYIKVTDSSIDTAPFTLLMYVDSKEDDDKTDEINKLRRMAMFVMIYKLYRYAKN